MLLSEIREILVKQDCQVILWAHQGGDRERTIRTRMRSR